LVLAVDCGVDPEDDDGGEDRKHVHYNLYHRPVHELLEAEFDFLGADILDLVSDQLLPAVVLDDSDAREVLVDALGPLVGPEQLVLPHLEPLLRDLVLEEHAHREHPWRD